MHSMGGGDTLPIFQGSWKCPALLHPPLPVCPKKIKCCYSGFHSHHSSSMFSWCIHEEWMAASKRPLKDDVSGTQEMEFICLEEQQPEDRGKLGLRDCLSLEVFNGLKNAFYHFN